MRRTLLFVSQGSTLHSAALPFPAMGQDPARLRAE